MVDSDIVRSVRFRDKTGKTCIGEWKDGSILYGQTRYDSSAVDILPATDPSKVVCVGLNYSDHAKEAGMDVPDRPTLFLKGPNTVIGHEDTIILPRRKERIDYEAELGVVIGKQCRNVAAKDAMDVIAGFTCVNDISNRDDQEIEQNWVRGKAFDTSAPIGPVVASPGLVPDDARIRLRLNGTICQDSSRSQLIFPIPELIREITSYITLERGDVIATGTPFGVGPLSDGDTVEVEIEGVGTLQNTVGTSQISR